MILVHLKKSWPEVAAGLRTEADATLGDWSGISDAALNKYADVVLGIYDNNVVTAYDIDLGRTRRDPDSKRVIFQGSPSATWEYLKGQPTPGRQWGRQGDTRPIQYIDTDQVASGAVPVEHVAQGRRAVVADYVLTVDDDGQAVLVMPSGRKVTVLAR